MVLRSSGTDPAGAKAEPNRDSKLVFLAGCAGISSSNIASAIAAVTGDNPGNIRVYRKKDLDLRRVKMPSAASAKTVLNAEQVFCNDREIRVNGWHPKPPPNSLGGEAAPADSSTDSEASVVSWKTTQTDMRDIEMRQHAIRLHGLASMLKDLSEIIMSRWKAPELIGSDESEPEMIEEIQGVAGMSKILQPLWELSAGTVLLDHAPPPPPPASATPVASPAVVHPTAKSRATAAPVVSPAIVQPTASSPAEAASKKTPGTNVLRGLPALTAARVNTEVKPSTHARLGLRDPPRKFPHGPTQTVIMTWSRAEKMEEIVKIASKDRKAIVFCNNILTGRSLFEHLSKKDIRAACMFGNETGEERLALVRSLDYMGMLIVTKTGFEHFMHNVNWFGLCTDKFRLPAVIYYDFPTIMEDYTHGIGSTILMNGKVISLFEPQLENVSLAKEILNFLRDCGQQIPDALRDAAYGWIKPPIVRLNSPPSAGQSRFVTPPSGITSGFATPTLSSLGPSTTRATAKATPSKPVPTGYGPMGRPAAAIGAPTSSSLVSIEHVAENLIDKFDRAMGLFSVSSGMAAGAETPNTAADDEGEAGEAAPDGEAPETAAGNEGEAGEAPGRELHWARRAFEVGAAAGEAFGTDAAERPAVAVAALQVRHLQPRRLRRLRRLRVRPLVNPEADLAGGLREVFRIE